MYALQSGRKVLTASKKDKRVSLSLLFYLIGNIVLAIIFFLAVTFQGCYFLPEFILNKCLSTTSEFMLRRWLLESSLGWGQVARGTNQVMRVLKFSAPPSRKVRRAGGWINYQWQENGNPLQYSCLGNPMGRGTWRAIVHGVAKQWTQFID